MAPGPVWIPFMHQSIVAITAERITSKPNIDIHFIMAFFFPLNSRLQLLHLK